MQAVIIIQMDKTLIQALRQLGCDDKHIRLYGAAQANGAASLPQLARLARLQRSTAYLMAADLLAKGLLLEDHSNYRKQYAPVEPVTILRMLAAQHRQLGRLNLAFKEHLPELEASYPATASRPQVRTYQGKHGVVLLREDMLRVRQEVLLWTNQATERQVFDGPMHELFVRERLARQISIRVLAVNNAEGRQLQARDPDHLRTTKLLPSSVTFTSETYIYGDKVTVVDVGRNIFGVITQNRQIAESQRAIFDLAWSGLS